MHAHWRGGNPRRAGISWAALLCAALVAAAMALTGCGLSPATYTQDAGLPTLHHLDWGIPFFQSANWSPDGRYIAGLAGDDYSRSHLQVITPDGRTRYDLGSWGCGEAESFDFAWLPDGRLSCIHGDPFEPPKLCIGAAPFASCQGVWLPDTVRTYGNMPGAVWTPDGSSLIVAAPVVVPLNDPNATISVRPGLEVVTHAGEIVQAINFDTQGGFLLPAWVPGQPGQLSYLLGDNLVTSTVSHDAKGVLTLSPPSLPLATVEFAGTDSRYAWAPSGQWIATRRVSSGQGGDKIYLVNAHDPSQTVDVVLADRINQQMIDPLWSPDGKSLIVFTVGVGTSQPYAIDIASYLKSKGLEP